MRSSKGCPKCGNGTGVAIRAGSQEDRLNTLIARHGHLYTYEDFVYTGQQGLITITCPTHGKFQRTYEIHRKERGGGCPHCGVITRPLRKSTKQGFINKAVKRYGDTYDYSSIEEYDGESEMPIICNVHNITFMQTPQDHLTKVGCSECNRIT